MLCWLLSLFNLTTYGKKRSVPPTGQVLHIVKILGAHRRVRRSTPAENRCFTEIMLPCYGLGTRHPENSYFTQHHIHTLQRHWVPILWPTCLFPTSPAGLQRAQLRLVSPVCPAGHPRKRGASRGCAHPAAPQGLLQGRARPGGVSGTQGLARDGDARAALPR